MPNTLIILICLILINISHQQCRPSSSIEDNTDCFNQVLYFNRSNRSYRSGHFALNKNGDMVVEYSSDQYRLFYGLKKSGEFYFENITKEIEIKIDYNFNYEDSTPNRYEAINSFVSLYDDTNKEKEYLLSISSYLTILELHDLETDEYKTAEAAVFLNKILGIYSNVFQILETKMGENIFYFLIYIYQAPSSDPNDRDFGRNIVIKSFSFSGFDFKQISNYPEIILHNNNNNRITSSLILDTYNVLVLFFMSDNIGTICAYTYKINPPVLENGPVISNIGIFNNIDTGNGLFFKACFLMNEYVGFINFIDYDFYIFKILEYQPGSYTFNEKISYSEINIRLSHKNTLNEFLKIDDNRLVLISNRYFFELYIVLFDLYEVYTKIFIRYYRYYFQNSELSSEISAFIYNDFLAFTGTLVKNSDTSATFSIFMIFGYANGTDSEIDISPYLLDSPNYNNSLNLYDYLTENLIIENNIFGYENAGKIKLVSIPQEILIFTDTNANSQIEDNGEMDSNSVIKQNTELIKGNKYYYLKYQFILKDPEYSKMIGHISIIKFNNTDEGEVANSLYTLNQKYYYGRTNTLKFKLCHKYCKTCKQLETNDNNQRCESCLDEYTYFHIEQNSSECIPQGYYLDKESNKIEECTQDNSKSYFDETNNKTICIKKSYACPQNYPNYDETKNECIFTHTTIPTTIPTTIITTIPATEATTSSFEETDITIIPTKEITTSTYEKTIISTEKITSEITAKATQIKSENSENLDTSNIFNSTENDENKELNVSTTIMETTITTINNKMNVSMVYAILNLTENYTNTEVYEKIDTTLLKNFEPGDESIEIPGEGNTMFQLTSSDNEMKALKGGSLHFTGASIVDLGDCEDTLRDIYKISDKYSLIIKKFEKLTISADRNVQYEVYHPINKSKLDLSYCEANSVNLYIPVNLTDDLIELYDDLKSSGYDLFNIEDPFYNDLCSPYKSKNGTDVLLSDRKNDYYNNNFTTCQSNCQYSAFEGSYQLLKCECKVVVDDIDIKKFDKFSKKITKTFVDILTNSNYKVLKCYKLVFNFEFFKTNMGSYIVLGFFGAYLCLMCVYLIKGIAPIQKDVMNTVRDKFKLDDEKAEDKNDVNTYDKKYSNSFPPKKRKSIAGQNTADVDGDADKKERRKSIKHKSRRKSKSKSHRKNDKEDKLNIIEATEKEEIVVEDINKKTHDKKHKSNERRKSKSKGKENNEKFEIKEKKDISKLDNLDLNNLVYDEAFEYDKRTFGQIYWNKLQKKHLLIYTFCAFHDYNLIYIKIARFIFLICTSMAMNVFFFFDSSMHKLYVDYGKYSFIAQIPQIIYSSIVSLVIEILIGFLSFTDVYIYQVRQLKEYKPEAVKKVLKSIKIKLIIFFVITFLFFAFYWYWISAFCAVYNNTQVTYFKDFATSFTLGLVYPFGIQLAFTIVRKCTLKDKTKVRSLLYKFA